MLLSHSKQSNSFYISSHNIVDNVSYNWGVSEGNALSSRTTSTYRILHSINTSDMDMSTPTPTASTWLQILRLVLVSTSATRATAGSKPELRRWLMKCSDTDNYSMDGDIIIGNNYSRCEAKGRYTRGLKTTGT